MRLLTFELLSSDCASIANCAITYYSCRFCCLRGVEVEGGVRNSGGNDRDALFRFAAAIQKERGWRGRGCAQFQSIGGGDVLDGGEFNVVLRDEGLEVFGVLMSCHARRPRELSERSEC